MSTSCYILVCESSVQVLNWSGIQPDPTFPLTAVFFFRDFGAQLSNGPRYIPWHGTVYFGSVEQLTEKRWGITQHTRIHNTITAAFNKPSTQPCIGGVLGLNSYFSFRLFRSNTFSTAWHGVEFLLRHIITKFFPSFSVHCSMGQNMPHGATPRYTVVHCSTGCPNRTNPQPQIERKSWACRENNAPVFHIGYTIIHKQWRTYTIYQ